MPTAEHAAAWDARTIPYHGQELWGRLLVDGSYAATVVLDPENEAWTWSVRRKSRNPFRSFGGYVYTCGREGSREYAMMRADEELTNIGISHDDFRPSGDGTPVFVEANLRRLRRELAWYALRCLLAVVVFGALCRLIVRAYTGH
ncbi:MAG: hypothetical protein ACHREM_04650 [Polyangiales bacterium]